MSSPLCDVYEMLLLALEAASDAGAAILGVYDSDFAVETKDDRSPLTLADRRSHEIISGKLSETGLQVLSEEGRNIPYEERSRWIRYWLVDPLDGTKEFVKRNGEFTVNIAIIEKGAPVLGVIYQPVRELFYFAAKGLGAYRAGSETFADRTSGAGTREGAMKKLMAESAKLPVSAASADILRIAGSRSHASPALDEFVEKAKQSGRTVDVLSAGSSLKFCLVAEGSADIYPRFGPTMEWDTAAGQCIVEESGGEVVWASDGAPVTYNREDLKNGDFICRRKNTFYTGGI